jgi:hypothetical protein
MEEFRIDQERFDEIRKKMLLKTIPLLVVASCIGMVIGYFNLRSNEAGNMNFLIVLPFVAALVGFNIFRSVKKQKEIILSYSLTIDRESITRKQLTMTPVTILKSDIREIIKYPDGSFIIKGNSKGSCINVPAQIEEHGYVESLLYGFHHVSEKNSKPLLERFGMLFSFVTLALMAAVYLSQDQLTVLVCGTALLLILGYSLLKIQLSKSVDQKIKNISWVVLLVMFSIIANIYFKLNGLT